MGNLLLSRLIVSISSALKDEVDIHDVICWTDSQIALCWIKGENKVFKSFVHNRVVEIRKNVEAGKWLYVKSKNNPADIITRDHSQDALQNELWWRGPDFLQEETNFFNAKSSLQDSNENIDSLEMKEEIVESLLVADVERNTVENLISIFEIVTCYVIRIKIYSQREKKFEKRKANIKQLRNR